MDKTKGRAARGNQMVQPGDEAPGFWDRPVLMNLVSDFFFLISAILLIWAGLAAVQRMPFFPLTQVVVANPLERVPRVQLENLAKGAFTGNFFTVNLDSAQAAFEKLPWVRRAEVRRRWPDGVEVALEEHRAMARWTPLDGEPRLVNSRGEVFAGTLPSTEVLPAFYGPEGSSGVVLSKYHEFANSLAQIGRKPVVVSLSSRQAWQLRLDDGVLIELGRDQERHSLGDRLKRFTNNYLAVSRNIPSVGVIDMRYPNGFVLRGHKTS